jgi:small subunit ribosomal protein S9
MTQSTQTKVKASRYYEAVGRRREAVSRVRLYSLNKSGEAMVGAKKYNKGDILINGKKFDTVYNRQVDKNKLLLPFKLTGIGDDYVTSIQIKGGGMVAQVGAAVHGLARAILLVDSGSFRYVLKQNGLLTRDPRKRESRKVGTGGKARRAKQSPKR